MYLSDLQTGEQAVIVKVSGHGSFRNRILEMGFVRGEVITSLLNAPLKDPVKYRLMGYEVSLRRNEARMIEVMTSSEAEEYLSRQQHYISYDCNIVRNAASAKGHEINIALVGNPNSGKTSLFNALSGGHEHVGNYSGVTVGAKYGQFRYRDYVFNITDLPGTYALSAYTPEELFVREHILSSNPDVIVNAVVSSNLERNLFLTSELIDADPQMVVALNMYDELERSGATLDYGCLGGMLGIPMVPVVAKSGKGLNRLLDTVIEVYEHGRSVVRSIHYSDPIEREIASMLRLIRPSQNEFPECFPMRYWALRLIQNDAGVVGMVSGIEGSERWLAYAAKARTRIREILDEDVESAVTSEKYGFIKGALHETYVPSPNDTSRTTTSIDRMVTNRWFGFPIFLLLVAVMFASTFYLGAVPQGWIESLVDWLGGTVAGIMSPGPLRSLIVDGIIGGVGSVIVFLPNILILYMFISLMEDSGYMARAAFIMDRIMHRIGLHGKSFIPMVMGFGCNVPAVMATRAIESRSSRLITILINPFMSCSARLPVFVLLAGTFFGARAGLAIALLYFLGVAVAVVTARLLRRSHFHEDETPFVMELPPYRVPTLRATLGHMWDKCRQYLQKIGGVILLASVIIWFLSYYPRPAAQVGQEAPTELSLSSGDSYLCRIGRFTEPVFKPLGLDWKAGVSLISGVAAKEIIVSTLGVIYAGDDDGDTAALSERLKASGDFPLSAASALLVFILLYCPCIAVLSTIAHETGSARWAVFSVIYNTAVAWILAFAVGRLIEILL